MGIEIQKKVFTKHYVVCIIEKGGDSMKEEKPIYQNPLSGRCPYQAFINSGTFGKHWHLEMEMLYVLPDSSSAEIYVDGVKTTLHERDFYIIDSTRVHSVETDTDCRMLVLEIGYGLLGEDFKLFAKSRFTNPLISFAEEEKSSSVPEIEQLLREISCEYIVQDKSRESEETKKSFISRMRLSSMLYRLTYMLADSLPMTDIETTHIREIQSMFSIQKIISDIHAHVERQYTVEQAASEAGYEKTRFCQLFKQTVGVSFHRYLNDYRMQAALPLLRDTALPIASIAESVGIQEGKTFARLFREKYGITPSEYRNTGRIDASDTEIIPKKSEKEG